MSASTDHAPAAAVTVGLDLGPGAYRVSGPETIEIAAQTVRGSTTLTFTPVTDGNRSDDEVSVDGHASGYTVTGTVLTIEEPPPGPPPRIVASVASSTIDESAGRVDVRLTLEHPPEVIDDDVGYTGCRLRLGAGSEAVEPADVTFSQQKKLNRGNGWSAEGWTAHRGGRHARGRRRDAGRRGLLHGGTTAARIRPTRTWSPCR